MYNSLIIANNFISKSKQTGEELTPMKLLKLVYVAHGWHLGIRCKPLVKELVLAWKYGPVIRELYEATKFYGRKQVTSLIDLDRSGVVSSGEVKLNDKKSIFIVDRTWEIYKDYNGERMSSLTHQPNTPWDITIKKSGIGSVIPDNLLFKYYRNKLERNIEQNRKQDNV